MTIDFAARLIYAHTPLVREVAGQLTAIPYEEAAAYCLDKIDECRRLARHMAEEVARWTG